MKNYREYEVVDFLNDNDFIKSVLSPTEETELFWNKLIDEGLLDIYEYTDAVLILSGWKGCLSEPDRDILDGLWERIAGDCVPAAAGKKAAIRRKGVFRLAIPLVAVSAAIAAAAVLLLFLSYGRTGKKTEEISVDPDYMLLSRAQDAENVVILSKGKKMFLEGNNPEISYDKDGNMSVGGAVRTGDGKQVPKEKVAPGMDSDEMMKIIVPFGKIARLELSDKSLLWINAGTSVSYPKTFTGSNREIFVDGEIYAKVAHDGNTFIVHTDELDVSVKGTSFDVSSYSTDDFSSVILVEGGVEVSDNRNVAFLAPGQAYTCRMGDTSIRTVDTDLYTSWTSGIYRFENAPIEDVMLKLARFYNVSIVLPKTSSGIICYGSLELKDDITTILGGLMKIASFNYVIKDGVYYIQFI